MRVNFVWTKVHTTDWRPDPRVWQTAQAIKTTSVSMVTIPRLIPPPFVHFCDGQTLSE